MSFLQVLALLAVLAYLILVALENPGLLHLPLPFGRGEWAVSIGSALAFSVVVGLAYGALLLLPQVWQEKWRRRQQQQQQKKLEGQLAATLQARLGNMALMQPSAEVLPIEQAQK